MINERFNETVREYIYRDEEYVNKRMEEDIEKYRKGNALIKFVDKDGKEVKGVKVEGGLIRYDLTDKPSYAALYNLIHNEWNTELSGIVDGELAFRGFYGEYEINAEVDGKMVTAKFNLSKNSDNDIVVKI